MNVERVMKKDVRACGPDDTLNRAAHLMWDNACGCLPVVSGRDQPIGILTDRDICMAAYTQGRDYSSNFYGPLGHHFALTMTCTARSTSCGERGTPLPVVDSDGRLRGIVSLDDLAAESLHSLRVAINRELANRLGEAFVSICARRACTSLGDHIADLTNERLRMVRQIAARGVRDPAVLEAMRRVRRSGGGKWRSD